MKTLHFKSKEAFRKWLAYEHIRTPAGLVAKAKKGRHSIAQTTPYTGFVYVGKNKHYVSPVKVKHTTHY